MMIRMFVLPLLFCIILCQLSYSQIQPDLPVYKGDFGETIHGLGSLEDVEFSPDGRYLATAGSNGVFLWDLEGNSSLPVKYFPVYRIEILENGLGYAFGEVQDIRWSRDGRYLRIPFSEYIIAQDIHIGNPFGLDRQRDIPEYGLILPEGSTLTNNFDLYLKQDGLTSPDRSRYITIDEPGATVWDASSETAIHSFPHYFLPYEMSFMNDGNTIVTAMRAERTAIVWDAKTFQPLRSFPYLPDGNEVHTHETRFSPSAPFMATFFSNNSETNIVITNVNTGETVKEIRGYTYGSVTAFSRDQQLAFFQSDKHHRIINLNTWQYETDIDFSDAGDHYVNDVEFSPDGDAVAVCLIEDERSGVNRIQVNIVDTHTGNITGLFYTDLRLTGYADAFLYFSENGKQIMVAQDTVAEVFDIQSTDRIATFPYPLEDGESADFYHPNRNLSQIVLALQDRFEKWDIETQTRLCSIELDRSGSDRETVLSPNGLALIETRRMGAYLFDTNRCTLVRQPDQFGLRFRSRDSPSLISGDDQWYLGFKGAVMQLYHIPSDSIVKQFLSHTLWNTSSVYLHHPDRKILVGRRDGTIVEFNTPSQSGIPFWKMYQD